MDDEALRHREVWALLPWLASGTATPGQQRQAQAHLLGCAECRAELAREEQLARAMRLPPRAAPDAERGLQRLMQRLDQSDDAPAVPGRWRLLAGARLGVGAVAALGLAEALLVAALGWWWLQAPLAGDAAPYRTLTQREAAGAEGPRWRVVFERQRSVGELQVLLARQGLVIVGGPSEAGAFTLGPAGPAGTPDADAVAAQLRQVPGVVFAEAVGGGGGS